MKIGNHQVGPYTIGCFFVGCGIGFIVHNLFAGLLIGLGVGYILDMIMKKHSDGSGCGCKSSEEESSKKE